MKSIQRKIVLGGLVTLPLAVASQSYAWVHVEAGFGQKTSQVKYENTAGESKTKSLAGTETVASLLVSPVPVVPFSFGIAMQSYSIKTSKIYQEQMEEALGETSSYFDVTTSGKTTGLLYGPSIKVWAPIPFVKPYLKYTYLMGTETSTYTASVNSNSTSPVEYALNSEGKLISDHSGADLQIGAEFSPIKFVSVFVEYAIHNGQNKLKDQTVSLNQTSEGSVTTATMTKDDLTDEDKKAKTANASSVRVGLAVGI